MKQLLEAGHKVRGYVCIMLPRPFFRGHAFKPMGLLHHRTARANKAEYVRSAYRAYGDQFEVTIVEDFANSDLSDAFKGPHLPPSTFHNI